jgi:hypothetical protein
MTSASNWRQVTSAIDLSTDPSPPAMDDNTHAIEHQATHNAQRTPTTHPNNIPSSVPQPTPHMYTHIYGYVHSSIKYAFDSSKRCTGRLYAGRAHDRCVVDANACELLGKPKRRTHIRILINMRDRLAGPCWQLSCRRVYIATERAAPSR